MQLNFKQLLQPKVNQQVESSIGKCMCHVPSSRNSHAVDTGDSYAIPPRSAKRGLRPEIYCLDFRADLLPTISGIAYISFLYVTPKPCTLDPTFMHW